MKYIVLDMMKFSLLYILIFGFSATILAQNKYEREHRIRKSQFPENALAFIEQKLEDARRIRFYKEIDSTKKSFEVKFKKDRLWYSVEFSEAGILEDIEILIKAIDIPNDTYANITTYLDKNFKRYSIRRLQQQYPVLNDEATTLKNAFQNLLLPSIHYEFIVSGKKEKGYHEYEILFDANGSLKNVRKSLSPNYDHVLY